MSISETNGKLPELPGGLGGGCRDTRAVERAIAQRWQIPEHLREILPKMLGQIVENPDASERNRIAAARALLSADKLNQEEEHQQAGGKKIKIEGAIEVREIIVRTHEEAKDVLASLERGSLN